MIRSNIPALIGKNKMTIAEVAKIAKLEYNTVESIYRDRAKGIKYETMNKLCFALNCTPAEMFTYIPDD
ncbi:MAG TPA: transcriptional regulator [Cyanobacteria bacterium UBA11991]|nr:helix-turn-helix transcriptional regulator [Cyanobacteriota bacterium]MDY6358901.1 helix-turn-helix transcriptional regulator [Cyanobacteriota bacterium]MDY6363988.1 helix-turn-helix transcriptional regulator [Cyanobacteriota bacterium]MDY6382959.1 helix-turn-helix transcriptional regulator [Cyanobacteriota bacterium]HCB10999.1 transcriptional regulator [Cyanobacteria bacterium UBA11991]